MEITVTLPEKVFQDITKYAELAKKPVGEVISEKIEADFQISNVDNDDVLLNWSDSDVLDLAKLKLPENQDERLSELLAKQREMQISPSERVEMEGLMGSYHIATFRKSQGIVEAIKRGLISSPDDLDE